MYPLIRCPSCNNSLGELQDIFQYLKNKKYEEEFFKSSDKKKENTVKPLANQVEISSLVDIDVEDIFNFLKVDRWCCRRVLLTTSTFDEQLFNMKSLH